MMLLRRHISKVFFGWWTPLAGGLLEFWSAGFYIYGISVFLKPIAAELGLSRAAISVASSIGRFEGGLEGPVAGLMCDRFGPRRVILLGVSVSVLGLLLMYYVNSLVAFIAVWGVVYGTGRNLSGGVPSDTAISNWFVKKRGVALSVKWIGAGLSGVITLPIIAWLMEVANLGWRMTCSIGGVVLALIGIPLTWLFIRDHRPEYYGLLPDGAPMDDSVANREQMIESGIKYAAGFQEVEFTARQAMRTPAYWLLIGVQGSATLVTPAMSTHLIPFLTDRGIDPLWAATMMAIMVGVGLPARFVGGYIADRIRIGQLRFLKGSMLLLQAVGVAVFLLHPTMEMIYLWFVLYGLGFGALHTLNPLIMARYFGRKAYGSIRGIATFFMTPAGIIAPIYVGWVYDTTGSYVDAFTLLTVLLFVSGVVMFLVSPPKPPEATNIRKIP